MSMFEQDSLHLRGEFTGIFNDWQTLVGFEFRDTELTALNTMKMMTKKSTAFCRTQSTQYGLFAFAERERNDWLTELAIRFDSMEQEAAHEQRSR